MHIAQIHAEPNNTQHRSRELLSFRFVMRYLPELALTSTVINLLALAVPITVTQIYDRIIPYQSYSTLGMLLGGVVVALVLDAALRIGRNYITGFIGSVFEHNLTCAAFRHLLDVPVSDYERDGPTVHIERLRAAAQVREFYSGQSLLALFDLPFAALYLGVMAVVGGSLVFAPLAMLVVFVAVTVYRGRQLKKDIRRQIDYEERRFSFLNEALSGIHSIKTMAMEAMMQRRYEMLQEINAERSQEGSQNSLRALNIGALFSQLTTVLVVAFGAHLVVDDRLTPGALAACILLAGRSLAPLQSALSTWIRFQAFAIARSQIEKLFDVPPAPAIGKPPLREVAGAITLEGVDFAFGDGAPLLSGIDLAIKPGECIAIVGDSGSGKSTLVGLMNGMVAPTAGRVLVDGEDISGYEPSSVARQISYVPQHGVLFDATILENITMFDESLEADALAVASQLGLDRVVATMRNGYDTRVGGGASDSMAAGVKQRIAIARALVRNPRVVLFDEANIAIDSAGDDFLCRALEALKADHTMVLVTHRPSLLKLADRVFTLRDGRLEEGKAGQAGGVAVAAPAEDGRLAARPDADLRVAQTVVRRFKSHTDLAMCLPVLLNALKWTGKARDLAEALPHVSDSLDLGGLNRVMANLKFRSDTSRVRQADIDVRLLPCLYLPDDGDARVLVRVNEASGRIEAFDGSRLVTDLLEPDATMGTIHVFRPVDEDEAAPAPGDSWLRRILGRFRSLMWLTMGMTLLINCLALAVPLFVMTVYDTVIPSGDTRLIPWLLGGLLIALVSDFGLRQLRGRVLAFIGARGEFIVGNAIFERLLGLPVAMTEQVPVGSQLSRIKDYENLRQLFVGPIALVFYELPGILVFVVVLGVLSPWLLLTLLVGIVAYALLGYALRPIMLRRSALASRLTTRRQEFLTDALTRMRALRYSGAEERWYEHFRLLSGRLAAAEFSSQQVNTQLGTLAQDLGMVTGMAVLTTAVVGSFSGAISHGAVLASMIVTWRLVAPLQNGFMSLSTLLRMGGSIRQIDNLVRMRSERANGGPRRASPVYRGELAFNRVSFRYTTEADPALLGVSFRVGQGQVAAIAGPNGAGKSTVLKLITGVYHPQAGSVRLDDVDIRQIEPADIRATIAYVPQRCDLFYGTIAQNLRLANPIASEAELRWAAEMAGLTEDIASLREGFDTRLLDGQGDQLANGFRQRLSLARAYLRRAPVMLFDEPGNGLDNEGDEAFIRAIERLRGKTTVILVSHRPSHLKLADTVVYMEEGYVRQAGTFDELRDIILGGAR